MKNEKKTILAIFVILFLIVIFLNYLYQLSQTKTPSLPEISQEEKAEQVEKFKEMLLKKEEGLPASVEPAENNSKENKGATGYETFFKEIKDSYQNREIIPYSEPLPPKPSKRESKARLYGVDSNYNGVRDDIEREIVKDFGNDRDMVEAMFAAVRNQTNKLYAVDNNIHLSIREWKDDFNPENRRIMEEIFNNDGKIVFCLGEIKDNSPEIYQGKDNWIDKKEENYLSTMYINSEEKEEYMRTFLKSVGGFGSDIGDWKNTYSNCLEFFESTKNFIPTN